MKAKFVFKANGEVLLGTIEGVAGTACTKQKETLKQLLPGTVDPGSEHKTNDYYKTNVGEKEVEVGG